MEIGPYIKVLPKFIMLHLLHFESKKKKTAVNMYSIFANFKSGCFYTTRQKQKFLTVRSLMFFKEFSSAHQACIYLGNKL